MNKTTYNRVKHNKDTPYLKISRALVQDPRLTAISVGLMTIILSNNDSFILNVSHLKRVCGLTRKQFYDAWNQLQQYQYIVQHRDGQHSYQYIINENPNQLEVSEMHSDAYHGVHANNK